MKDKPDDEPVLESHEGPVTESIISKIGDRQKMHFISTPGKWKDFAGLISNPELRCAKR